MEFNQHRIADLKSRVDPTLLIGRKVIQFFTHSRQMTLPMWAWHISCSLQIWSHLSKTRHSSIYRKHYIKKIPSMFSVGELGAYIGRFGDYASYKVHLWPKSKLLEWRLSHGLQANLIYISVYTGIHNLSGYKEDMMPCTVTGMLYFGQQLWALCALCIDLTKKMGWL